MAEEEIDNIEHNTNNTYQYIDNVMSHILYYTCGSNITPLYDSYGGTIKVAVNGNSGCNFISQLCFKKVKQQSLSSQTCAFGIYLYECGCI